MNISLQKIKHLLFLALLAVPILGQAQAGLLQEKTAFKNTPLKIWAQDLSTAGLLLRTNPKPHGALTVDPVFPVVNHGSVTVDEERGYVNFIPEAGYTGLADFNYVACDSVGTCAMGSVTVYVNEPSATFNDAIRLGTGQNTTKAIPMPFMVTSIGTPTKGRGKVSIEKSAYAVVYQPNLDEFGDDEFIVYGENGNQRKVTLDIIERPVNSTSLAKDDVVYAIVEMERLLLHRMRDLEELVEFGIKFLMRATWNTLVLLMWFMIEIILAQM